MSLKPRRILSGLIAGLALLWSHGASALTCTATADPIAFGTYSPGNIVADTTVANLTVTCITPIGLLNFYSVSLSAGSSGSASARAMVNGAWAMSYQLYSDPTYTTIWGDGTGSSRTVTDGYAIALLNVPVIKVYPIYASAPARQNIGAGIYTDTITILLTY